MNYRKERKETKRRYVFFSKGQHTEYMGSKDRKYWHVLNVTEEKRGRKEKKKS